MDMERALAGTCYPKCVVIYAHLLSPSNHKTWNYVKSALKQVGCHELVLQGKSAHAPRRVYEHDIATVLTWVRSTRLKKLTLLNLDIQRAAVADAGVVAEEGAAAPEEQQQQQQQPSERKLTLKERLSQFHHLEDFHLQSVRLEDVEPATPTAASIRTTDTLMDDVLRLLQSGLSNLKHVSLQFCDEITDPIQKRRLLETMTDLASRGKAVPSKTPMPRQSRLEQKMKSKWSPLSSLAISEYPTNRTDPAVKAFWKAIATSPALTHLSLFYRGERDTEESNDHVNEEEDDQVVQLGVASTSDAKTEDSGLPFPWNMLQQNTSIQQLELHVQPGVDMEPLLRYLKDNTTLLKLVLHLEQDPTDIAQALTQVVEQDNLTLQSVNLLCHNLYGYKVRIPCRKLDFYTKLNRTGRDKLVRGTPVAGAAGITIKTTVATVWTSDCGFATQTTTTTSPLIRPAAEMAALTTPAKDADFIHAMASNNYDINCLYYWLHANPNLFSRATTTQ